MRTLASCVNRAIIPLVADYCKDILLPVSFSCSSVVPCAVVFLSVAADFSIHGEGKKKEQRSRRRRENIFMDINLFLPFSRDWKANAEEAFEPWIGSQPTSILSNLPPLSSVPPPSILSRQNCLVRNHASYEKKRPAWNFLPRQTSFINPLPTTSSTFVSRGSH